MSRSLYLDAKWHSLVLAASMVLHVQAAELAPSSPVSLAVSDRILVLAPHPDDEAIGCGGIIQASTAMKLPLRIVYLTYGDNNEWSFLVYRRHAVVFPAAVKGMGLLRHDEAVAATAALGVSSNQLAFLGYPDFRTLHMWLEHWGTNMPPAEGMLTRASAVPYANAFRPGAPYRGEEVIRDLVTVLREFKPTKVFVSHPADYNIDHRALYCFCKVALWNIENELRPEVFPYLVHFPHWPVPRDETPDRALDPPAFFREELSWRAFGLTPGWVAGKRAAIRLHQSQFQYAGRYLSSFVRTNELFGDFPPIVFGGPSSNRAGMRPVSQGPRYGGDEEDQLTEAEQNRFVGVEWRHIQIETNTVNVFIDLSRPLAETVSASVQVFGYRHDVPFERMPKIRVEIGTMGHGVRDRGATLPPETVVVKHRLKEIEAVVPLAVLGEPERLLVCARTYLGEIPLDWVSWRVVELSHRGTHPNL